VVKIRCSPRYCKWLKNLRVHWNATILGREVLILAISQETCLKNKMYLSEGKRNFKEAATIFKLPLK